MAGRGNTAPVKEHHDGSKPFPPHITLAEGLDSVPPLSDALSRPQVEMSPHEPFSAPKVPYSFFAVRFSSRLLVTTQMELSAMAAAAHMGGILPNIAAGIRMIL